MLLGSWEQLVKAPFIEKSYDFNTNKILYIILWSKDSVIHLWLNSIFSVKIQVAQHCYVFTI